MMTYISGKQRRQLRLAGYEYQSAGYYYVTLCTQNRLCLFGNISDGQMLLNDSGKMLHHVWTNLPNRYPNLDLDNFVIMPNHIHAIVVISQRPSPTNASLSEIIKNFKTYTSWRYIDGVRTFGWPSYEKRLWQRNFYEHIIRNNRNLLRIQQYIIDNPLKWDLDIENPDKIII